MSRSHSIVVATAPVGQELAKPVPSALSGSLEVLTRMSVGLMVMLLNWTRATKRLENPHFINSVANPPTTISALLDSDTN